MLINELVDDLRWQIDPDIEDAIFVLSFESLEKVSLYIGDDCMRATEVVMVPVAVCLAVTETLLAYAAVCKQVVNEFYRKDLDFIIVFKSTHADVVSLGDVKEYAVYKE